MATVHEVQKKDTPGAETPSHNKPQSLGEQMQHVGTQARETVQDIGAYVKETAQDLGNQAKETAQTVGTQVYEQGQKSLQDLNQTIEGQIRERPLQALLVAGVIGMLLGFLWRRS
jgi:ElaB/YqjD/DUF883 family membrane-anchored ribosome-binding protein